MGQFPSSIPGRKHRISIRAQLCASAIMLSLCGFNRAAGPAAQTPNVPETSVEQAIAGADKDTGSPLTIDSAIAQLGAAQYAARDGAEHFLMQQSPQALPTIEKALESADDTEVVSRLNRVAVHLFLKGRTQFEGSAGLLGIGLSLATVRLGPHDDDVHTAITILGLQPGFPAAEVLRPGDTIIALNNEPFPIDMTIDFFRRHVMTTPPGTVVRLTVLRGRERFEVNVMLAGIPDGGEQAIAGFILERQRAASAYLRQLHPKREASLTIPTPDDPVVVGGQ